MENKKMTRKISQGMYVLTTNGGGCIIDAVMQVSGGDSPLIAISVMKDNYTNELLKKNKCFSLSVLGKDVDPNIIKTFGFNSMRDINKFEKVDTIIKQNLNIIKDSLGYMICDIIDFIDNETHTLFIGKLTENDMFKDEEAMTYNFYQENKEELLKIKTSSGKTAWICTVCGYIYYGDKLPQDYICPVCKASANAFEKK